MGKNGRGIPILGRLFSKTSRGPPNLTPDGSRAGAARPDAPDAQDRSQSRAPPDSSMPPRSCPDTLAPTQAESLKTVFDWTSTSQPARPASNPPAHAAEDRVNRDSGPAGHEPPGTEQPQSSDSANTSFSFGKVPPRRAHRSHGDPVGGAATSPAPATKLSSRPLGGKSCLLAVSPACPPKMLRDDWAITDFSLQKKLYSSKVSLVYSATCKRSGMPVAIKLYMRSALQDPHKIQAMREISFHCDVCHRHILSMYAAWADGTYIYMILEYADHGDLYRILRYKGPLPESIVVAEVLLPLLEALNYMHSLGLVHRDLKPENILITASGIKVADLGLVINDIQEKPNTRLGTLDYMAPEVFLMKRKAHPMQDKTNETVGYDSKVDVWSVGVIMYELLTGVLPFQQEHVGNTVNAICSVSFRPFPDNMPPLAEDFIRTIFKKDPVERPSCKELGRHPWIAAAAAGHFTTKPLPMTAGLPLRGLTTRTQGTDGTWQELFMRLEPGRTDLLGDAGEGSWGRRTPRPDIASKIQF